MAKILGILGGMGPIATANLFEKIILATDAKCDQDHIRILIDNNTSIPDRTSYILGCGEDPRKYLIESACKLEAMGADFLVMPCNTAHYFYDDIVKNISIPFLNMIEETAKYTSDVYKGERRIGLLATEGTCKANVYDKVFSRYGIEIVKPSDDKQIHVTNLIYEIKEGDMNIDLTAYYSTVDELRGKGAGVFILGCTELSFAHKVFKMEGTYVDPVDILAASAVKFAGKKVNSV